VAKPDLSLKGIVFDFQRFSTHDGPGIRSMVFLKGCPLRCPWCANPESQRLEPLLGFFKNKCNNCYACTNVCPQGAFFQEHGDIDWEACSNCLKCVDVCMYEARKVYGQELSVEQVVSELLKDKPFFKTSGGGITISGGDPVYQYEFTYNILLACRQQDIHTAVETSGYATNRVFRKIAEQTDLLLYDFKHMDPIMHKETIGVSNEIILENAVMAAEIVPEMIIRIPFIPGFNDSTKNISQMGNFITKRLPRVRKVDILPYHSMGESKSIAIGREYGFPQGTEVTEEKEHEARQILEKFGLKVSIGG